MKTEDIYMLSPEIADLSEKIEALSKKRDAIEKQAKKLHSQRDKLISAAAKEATTPLEIAAFRHSGQAAYQRMRALVKSLHPAFFESINWSRTDEIGNAVGSPILGVHMALDYKPGDEYVDSLAKALRDFVETFKIELPAASEGYHYADMLTYDCGETQNWKLFYDPVADRAKLEDVRWSSGEKFEGTVREMVAKACEVAWYRNGPEPSADDDY